MTIRLKLFLALLFSGILVAGSLFLFLQWSFDHDFLRYVNQRQQQRMAQITRRLGEEYGRYGNWGFLRTPGAWQRLDILRPHHHAAGQEAFPHRTPPALLHRLYNAKREPLFGPPERQPPAHMIAIRHQQTVVGYLATPPLRQLSDIGDLQFMAQQTQVFAIVSLAMALFSLLFSFPLANHLLRPVRELSAGTRQLTAGAYHARITPRTSDELGQLCRDFNLLAATLENNEQARQQWVADISHELRTPLAVLRAEIEAIQDGVRPPDDRNIAVLHDEVLHLIRLVEDLYELSMSDIGALSYKMTTTQPLALLADALEVFTRRYASKGLVLESQLPAQEINMQADPDRLQQLFSNLLENSYRYTDVPGRAIVSACMDHGVLQVVIEDSAPGVPPEQLPRLFERLYRADPSRHRTTGGAGLGLSICQNIVQAHQGSISAEPSRFGGLRICIKLPVA